MKDFGRSESITGIHNNYYYWVLEIFFLVCLFMCFFCFIIIISYLGEGIVALLAPPTGFQGANLWYPQWSEVVPAAEISINTKTILIFYNAFNTKKKSLSLPSQIWGCSQRNKKNFHLSTYSSLLDVLSILSCLSSIPKYTTTLFCLRVNYEHVNEELVFRPIRERLGGIKSKFNMEQACYLVLQFTSH